MADYEMIPIINLLRFVSIANNAILQVVHQQMLLEV